VWSAAPQMARPLAALCLALLAPAARTVRARSPGAATTVAHGAPPDGLFGKLEVADVVDVPFMSARLRMSAPHIFGRLNKDVAKMIAEFTEDKTGRRVAQNMNGTTITYMLHDDSLSTPGLWQFAFALRGGHLFAQLRTRAQGYAWGEPVVLELSPRFKKKDGAFYCLFGKSAVAFAGMAEPGEASFEFRQDGRDGSIFMRITYSAPPNTIGSSGGRQVLTPMEVARGGLPLDA